MNIILFEENDFVSDLQASVILSGRRFEHLKKIIKAQKGDILRVGVINGKRGTALVESIDCNCCHLTVTLVKEPLPSLPVTLICALSRPQTVKKTLLCSVTMGVKEIFFINSSRVEKSYWSSPITAQENLLKLSIEALEQAGDTILPKIHLRKRFKPFVEDELPDLCKNSYNIVAHPCAEITAHNKKQNSSATVVIGPEGGFIPYELEKFMACGFTTFSLGERILRVEQAVPVVLAKLF